RGLARVAGDELAHHPHARQDHDVDGGMRVEPAVIAFELTVLFAALTPAIGMLALNGLPRLHHPVFATPSFHRASKDRFFLCVLASDARFDPEKTMDYLRALDASSVEPVASWSGRSCSFA